EKKRQWAYELSKCMTCGVCLEACPNVNDKSDFIGPAALSQARLFNAHPTGMKAAVQEELKLAEELLRDLDCQDWKVASDPTEQKKIWQARHELSYAFSHVKGMSDTGADVCVPISRLPELVVYA